MLKVKFKSPTIQAEANIIFNFSYSEKPQTWDWNEIVYGQHPKLKEMIEGVTDKKEFKDRCYQYAEGYINENKKLIVQARENFQKSWEKVEQAFFANVTKDFETSYPEKVREIKANVSINPICPRYLDKWSFNLFYNFPDVRMKSVCIHEIIHFFYLKKWLEVFPNYDKRKFDAHIQNGC
jgi:hypothetical protein